MAGNTWRTRVLDLVIVAEDRCVDARTRLGDYEDRIIPPMHVADAQAVRGWAQRLRYVLEGVSVDLAYAMSAMVAAELVVLRGAADNPTAPLPFFQAVPDADHFLRRALEELRVALGSAARAYRSVELCIGHLFTALELLYHPGLPGVDGFLDAERVAVRDGIFVAVNNAAECAALVNYARRSTERSFH
ncbi:hypothetical protein ACP70R_031132 [Stipagrostis hirtigluma subsp. patula]